MSDYQKVNVNTSSPVVPPGDPAAAPPTASPEDAAAPTMEPQPSLTIPVERHPDLPANFTDVATLAQSYADAQRKITQLSVGLYPPQEASTDPPAAPAAPAAPPAMSSIFAEAAEEFGRTGSFSPKTSADLRAAGVPDDAQYIWLQGMNSVQAARVTAVQKAAGGQENYQKAMTWANSNLSPEDRAAFNQAIEYGDEPIATLAVQGLMSRFQGVPGPQLVQGRPVAPPAGMQPFKSRHEAKEFQRSRQYTSGDPAVQEEWRARFAAGKSAGHFE